MPYKLIKGEFFLFYESKLNRHVGSQPDGDSVWFKPNQPKLLKNIDGRSAKSNGGGFIQLRFEAIDALETHFQAKHQNMVNALKARDYNLQKLSFRKVDYSGDNMLTVKNATPHPTEGYILTRSIDPYGRPVSFVFKGKVSKPDGADVTVEVPLLNKSINAILAKNGNAYPSFYTGLPTDLRNRIKKLADDAKRKKMWKEDKTLKGAKVRNLDDLQKVVMFPKLFRRLVSFFKSGKKDIKKFEKWLREDEDRDDKLWIISKAEFANMHDVIDVTGKTIKMLFAPDDLIIVPR
jgi:hypothetical protein